MDRSSRITIKGTSLYQLGYKNLLAKKDTVYGIKATENETQIATLVPIDGGGGVPIATTETPGIVKPDGTTITIEEDGTISSIGGGGTFTSPAPTIALGGIAAGSTFENATAQEMFEALLCPELFPTLTAPSLALAKSPNTDFYEIGASLSFDLTATFNRGSISPAYTTSGYRSGLPNKYTWTGAQIAGETPSTALTDSKSITDYTVLSGANTWGCTVAYDAGEQPKSSKGNDYNSPLPAGTVNKSISITGVYPYYATTANITTMTKQPLKAMDTEYTEIALVTETDSDKQKVAFPDAWSTITGIKFYNTLNNTWEWIGGDKTASLELFTITNTQYTVQGSSINYKLYTFNGAKTGARSLRFYTT